MDDCRMQRVSNMGSLVNSALLPRWLFRIRHQRQRLLSLTRCRLQPRHQTQEISDLE
jgi:hypothetical protein